MATPLPLLPQPVSSTLPAADVVGFQNGSSAPTLPLRHSPAMVLFPSTEGAGTCSIDGTEDGVHLEEPVPPFVVQQGSGGQNMRQRIADQLSLVLQACIAPALCMTHA